MTNHQLDPLLEAVIDFLKTNGKSADVSALLLTIKVEEPSPLHDFLVELALTASPEEEEGVGCYSVEEIGVVFNEFKKTGRVVEL